MILISNKQRDNIVKHLAAIERLPENNLRTRNQKQQAKELAKILINKKTTEL